MLRKKKKTVILRGKSPQQSVRYILERLTADFPPDEACRIMQDVVVELFFDKRMKAAPRLKLLQQMVKDYHVTDAVGNVLEVG